MRILIVSQYFWPESFRINDVTKSLVDKGHVVEVLTGKPNYPSGTFFEGYKSFGCQKEIHQGVYVNRIPLFSRGRNGLSLAINYLSFLLSGLLFAPFALAQRKYDVIFVYAPSPIFQAIPAIFLGWLKKVPVILWVQDLWPDSLSATGYVKNKFVLKLVECVVRFIYRHVDLLLVQSKAFIKPVSELAADTPVYYYPNSVDDSFAQESLLPTPEIEGLADGFSIMFAGNIGSAQAVETIIDAATLLNNHLDIKFVILGEGSRREWMLQEAKRRDLTNMHLPGRFPVEMMPAFMQKASVLLVTLSDQEIFAATVPNKIQAYMAAGRPIIACLNGEGARLVLEANAGVSVPAEDASGLVDAILKLYEMTAAERSVLGFNGRAYYKNHFDHDTLVDELIAHFQAVCRQRKDAN